MLRRGGNVLCCLRWGALGLAVLDVIEEEGLCARALAIGNLITLHGDIFNTQVETA